MGMSRAEASRALPGWRYLLGRMHLLVDAGSFEDALRLVNDIAALAVEQDHHPDIDLRYSTVHVVTSSHDVGAITDRDVRLGTAITELVDERGLTPKHPELTELEIAIDAMDIPAVMPFWRAITGYEPDGDESLVDPLAIGPSIWFQQMDEPRPERNRIHIDVTVAHDESRARVAAALEAGGVLVSDEAAPRFWVLADKEGNEACVCAWPGRDELEQGQQA